jgi:hypothetical protein
MKSWIDIGTQAICIAVSLAGLAVAVWVVVSGLPGKEGLDAMFLFLVGISFAVFFGMIPVQAIRRGEWKLFARREKPEKEPEVKRDSSANA